MEEKAFVLSALIGPWVFALGFAKERPPIGDDLRPFVVGKDLTADWSVQFRESHQSRTQMDIPVKEIKGSTTSLLCRRFQAPVLKLDVLAIYKDG